MRDCRRRGRNADEEKERKRQTTEATKKFPRNHAWRGHGWRKIENHPESQLQPTRAATETAGACWRLPALSGSWSRLHSAERLDLKLSWLEMARRFDTARSRTYAVDHGEGWQQVTEVVSYMHILFVSSARKFLEQLLCALSLSDNHQFLSFCTFWWVPFYALCLRVESLYEAITVNETNVEIFHVVKGWPNHDGP